MGRPTEEEFRRHLPTEEITLLGHKRDLEASVRDSEHEGVRRTLSDAALDIERQLKRLRFPETTQQTLDTAAQVHLIRHFRARGMPLPLNTDLEAEARKVLEFNWRPSPGNLQWCSCNACIHNCAVLRELNLEETP